MTRFIKKRNEMKSSPKGNSPKCAYHNCKGKVVGNMKIDIDMKGHDYCKKHKQNISNAIVWMLLGVYELADYEVGKTPTKKK